MGGFYNSLFLLGLIVYSQFQGTLFFSGIISKLYLVDEPPADRKKAKIEPMKHDSSGREESFAGRANGFASSSAQ
jgi:hypothetical protein